MDIQAKIKMAIAYVKMTNPGFSEAELARRIGSTPQAFSQRLKTGKFTSSDLEQIAAALGGTYVCYFEFPDGTKIQP